MRIDNIGDHFITSEQIMTTTVALTQATAPATISATDQVAGAVTSEHAVQVAVRAAAGLGIPGIFHPGLDEAGMGAIWLTMVTTIAKREGAEISAATAAKLVASAVASVSAYSMGSKVLTWALLLIAHALPFVVIPAGVALNVALNALFTYKLGKSCIRRFSDPKFNPRDAIAIGAHMVMTPTLSEIGDLKRILTGA